MKGLSLQIKFILVTSLSILALMSVMGYWGVKRESAIMYKDLERQGKLLAETLAIPMINDLIYEKLGLVEEGGLIDNYVTEIFGRKELDILYIMVLDAQGKVISHNDFTEYGKVYDDSLTRQAIEADMTTLQRFHDTVSGHDAIDVASPLSIGKKRWGTLKFAISLENLEKEIRALIIKVIALTLIALVIGFGAIIGLSKRFIGPITYLAKTMEKASGESLDVKVDIKGKDELALLGQSFNNMIMRIRSANEELRKAQEKLIQTEKLASIGVLSSGIAHEINNPLGGIFNCVNMLKEKGRGEESRQQYLALLHDGLQRIESTVGKLLWMSRKRVYGKEIINIKSVLDDVSSFIEYRMSDEGIIYESEVDELLSVAMERNDLHHVLINLLINSMQAMNGKGIISVEAFRDEKGNAVIKIKDTGEGIDEENITRIFDPFYTTKQPGEGTGLGLWMTYDVIKNYGGEVDVSSQRGKGTVFTIKLKAVNEHDA